MPRLDRAGSPGASMPAEAGGLCPIVESSRPAHGVGEIGSPGISLLRFCSIVQSTPDTTRR